MSSQVKLLLWVHTPHFEKPGSVKSLVLSGGILLSRGKRQPTSAQSLPALVSLKWPGCGSQRPWGSEAGQGWLESWVSLEYQTYGHFLCVLWREPVREAPHSLHRSLTGSVRCGHEDRKEGMWGAGGRWRWWGGRFENIVSWAEIRCLRWKKLPWGPVCSLCSPEDSPCHSGWPSPPLPVPMRLPEFRVMPLWF